MKTLNFQNREEWLAARRGKITGTRLGGLISKRDPAKKKIGFYEIIAERISLPPTTENPMDRGTRLEEEAVERFVKEYKKKVNTDLILWTRDDNDSIAVSPDATIGKKEAVEAKCLGSARHIEAYLTNQIPEEFEFQRLQYFIVNPDLQILYFVFYDPRIPAKDFFVLTVHRKEVQKEIDLYLDYQKKVLLEIDEIVNKLTY